MHAADGNVQIFLLLNYNKVRLFTFIMSVKTLGIYEYILLLLLLLINTKKEKIINQSQQRRAIRGSAGLIDDDGAKRFQKYLNSQAALNQL